jgi:hypothetical protein
MNWPCNLPRKFPLWIAASALLAGCATPPLALVPAPAALATPTLSAAEIHKAEQHEYWAGYAAGRRYQKQQDAQATPDAPSPTPMADTPPVPASVPTPAPIPAPLQPAPPPVDGYAVQGLAKPVATPVN